MKNIFYPLAAAFILAASAFTVLTTQDWAIKDTHSIKFSGKGAEGVFKDLAGTIRFDENDLGSSFMDVTIEVKSINTGNGLKNKHATSEKYFDAEHSPYIKFNSNTFTKVGNGYEAKGTLEIRGTKKPFTIPFTFQKNGADGVFNGAFEVNRTDFSVGGPGGQVADVLKVEVSVPVSPK